MPGEIQSLEVEFTVRGGQRMATVSQYTYAILYPDLVIVSRKNSIAMILSDPHIIRTCKIAKIGI